MVKTTQKLSNYATGKFIKVYTGHTNKVFCITSAFSVTNGKYIVRGSEDNCVYLWDLQHKTILQRLQGHTDALVSVSCHQEWGYLKHEFEYKTKICNLLREIDYTRWSVIAISAWWWRYIHHTWKHANEILLLISTLSMLFIKLTILNKYEVPLGLVN